MFAVAAAGSSTSLCRALVSWRTFAILLLIAGSTVGYLAYTTIDSQRAELNILARGLAASKLSEDGLTTARDQLIGERERLIGERDGERARAVDAETRMVDVNIQLSTARSDAETLRTQLSTATSAVSRLQQESAQLRQRIESVQSEARDQVRASDMAAAAQRRAEELALTVADVTKASTDLSATRDRMINVLLDQIKAERAGRVVSANALVADYNSLVAVHNRQLAQFNTALAKLRGMLT